MDRLTTNLVEQLEPSGGAEIGPLIGKLDRAFARSRDSLPSESQAFAKFGTNQILRETVANFLALCEYEYVPDNTDAA
jgi:hypothetical protein